jgi:hypothetical protein
LGCQVGACACWFHCCVPNFPWSLVSFCISWIEWAAFTLETTKFFVLRRRLFREYVSIFTRNVILLNLTWLFPWWSCRSYVDKCISQLVSSLD